MNAGIELAFQKLDMNQTLADLQATIDAAAGAESRRCRLLLRRSALVVQLQPQQRLGCFGLLWWWHPGQRRYDALLSHYPPLWRAGRSHSDGLGGRFFSKQPDLPFMSAADHGFNRDQRDAFDATAASQARERTLALFNDRSPPERLCREDRHHRWQSSQRLPDASRPISQRHPLLAGQRQ